MKGTIKAYSTCVSAGVIKGDDGKSYGFNKTDWKAAELPKKDETVSFEQASKQAMNVRKSADAI